MPEGIGIAALRIALLIPFAAIQVPRWHDTDRSAWYALWALLPGLGMNLYIAIPLGLIPGTKGQNQYGKGPARSSDQNEGTGEA